MKRLARPDPAHLQMKCDLFNAHNPVGSAVTVLRDNGDVQTTTTRTKAEVMSGHSAVIWLDGISGCYMLDRVTPVTGGAA